MNVELVYTLSYARRGENSKRIKFFENIVNTVTHIKIYKSDTGYILLAPDFQNKMCE